jgi:zinc transport system substrate-binding protein
LLLDNGVDLHSYQPTADDILTIAGCDLFVYVGGESDEWVDDVLAQATNKNMKVINLLDVLGDSAREEELVEGMESEEEHDGEHEDEEEEEGPEYDEHVWLSLRNTEVFCREIADALGDIDPDNSDAYHANAESYVKELEDLDGQYTEAVKDAKVKTLVFGDRFPFRYLVDDYGLDYYAAFAGCSAESEASFETITFLAKKVDELKLNYVMTIEGTDHSIAETIIKNTETKDQQILTLDSMQSTTSASEDHYSDIMKSNLEVLKQALQN